MHKTAKGVMAGAVALCLLTCNYGQIGIDRVPSDGYISTTSAKESSSVEGVIRFKQFEPETFLKTLPFRLPFFHEYKNISDIRDNATIQFNFFLKGLTMDMKTRRYWVQDVLQINKKNGKMSYYAHSEIFALNREMEPQNIGVKIEGRGKVFTPILYGDKKPDTYIFTASQAEKLPIPSTITLKMDTKTINGRIEITFMAGGKNPKAFDKIKIGSRNEFLWSYFYTSKKAPGELGFGDASQVLENRKIVDPNKIFITEAKLDATLKILRDGEKQADYNNSMGVDITTAEKLKGRMWIRTETQKGVELRSNGRR